MTTYKLRKLGQFGHNQLLVTGQISLCTSDGGGIVCFIINYLIYSLVITLIDYLEILNDLANIGITPGRCTRGRPLKHTASIVIVHLVQNGYCIRGGWGVCVLAIFCHYFTRYPSYSTIESSNYECKYWKPHVSSFIRSWCNWSDLMGNWPAVRVKRSRVLGQVTRPPSNVENVNLLFLILNIIFNCFSPNRVAVCNVNWNVVREISLWITLVLSSTDSRPAFCSLLWVF